MEELANKVDEEDASSVQQAIEDDQERKEREERQERREGTKYGAKIDGEIER